MCEILPWKLPEKVEREFDHYEVELVGCYGNRWECKHCDFVGKGFRQVLEHWAQHRVTEMQLELFNANSDS